MKEDEQEVNLKLSILIEKLFSKGILTIEDIGDLTLLNMTLNASKPTK